MNLSSQCRKKSSSIINITSLIDVVLLLLIFFMLTTRFVEQPGMKLDLPDSPVSEQSSKNENNIYISADGTVNLNDEKIEIDELPQKLPALVDTSLTENSITIKADRTIDYGTVVNIMGKSKKAGFTKLIIATDKDD